MKTMTTISINERTKAGKTLLELARILAISNKGVSINVDVNRPVVNSEIYNPKFLAKVKAAKKQISDGKTVTIDTKSIWESIK
jgi:hypothetical protein